MSRFKTWGRRIRTAWLMIGVSLCLLLAVEASCRLICSVNDPPSSADEYPTFDQEIYGDAPWLEEFWREDREARKDMKWQPYTYWRRAPYKGQFINIDSRGTRKTWKGPQGKTQRQFRVFAFGGSTMWGTGVRDDFTIASYLAKQLEDSGISVEVTNFGESGYVSKQELITLIGELENGNVPDVVVFYDGINDTFSAFQNGEAGIPQNESHRRVEFNSRDRKVGMRDFVRWLFPGTLGMAATVRSGMRGKQPVVSLQSADDVGDSTSNGDDLQRKLADDVVHRYKAVFNMVKELGRTHGFAVQFYWQPTVYQKPHRSALEEAAANKLAEFGGFLNTTYGCIQSDIALENDPAFHDLSNIFAAETVPVFIDECHIGEAGNEKVARYISQRVNEALTAAAAQRSGAIIHAANRNE